MKNKEKIKKQLIELLLKKAEGFHYQEEQYEYESEKKSKGQKCENLNFFDLCDRGKSSLQQDSVNIKPANETIVCEKNEKLILVKKKVTSHYIPPDMLAIKILLEMCGQEKLNKLEEMTDEELIKFKEKILEELQNENN